MTIDQWKEWLRPGPVSDLAKAVFAPATKVVVYGAGSAGADLVQALRAQGVNVVAVLDAKSTRTECAGLPVHRPDAAAFTDLDRSSTLVALGIFNAFVDILALQARLAQCGWRYVVDFAEIHALIPSVLGDRYWLTARDATQVHSAQIAAVDAMWADEQSRELFRSLLRFRVTGDRRGLPVPDPSRQYFALDVPPWPEPLRMVDCGACDGDTLEQVERLGLNIEALALFEPDLLNFARLTERARKWRNRGIPVLAWPCGVHDSSQLLRFRGSQGAASAFDQGGDVIVPCVALDDALIGFRPNLLKMDIEGAEAHALAGARRLIEEHHPGLAICVYHKPEDLWLVPALVDSWKLGYRLFLRTHQFSGFDTVLYAAPPGR